jgi:hypothetical protein
MIDPACVAGLKATGVFKPDNPIEARMGASVAGQGFAAD